VWKINIFDANYARESLHETSNENGLVSFAAAKYITSSTTFPHKTIHKATWKSPDDHLQPDRSYTHLKKISVMHKRHT